GFRARRLGTGVDPQPAPRPTGRARVLLPVHHSRPGDRRVPLRPRRGHVPGQDRRGRLAPRAVRAPEAPLHAGTALGGRDARSGRAARAEADRARRRHPEPDDPAVGMPVSDALPTRAAIGAALARGGAAAPRRRPRPLRRLPSRRARRSRAAARRPRRGRRLMFTTRPELRGTFGMVASTHWLASAVGMAVLEEGGNAFDAAVATGLTLQVVEPHLNGPGGEVPILLYSAERDETLVVCGQGTAPEAATISQFRSLGLDLVPGTGLLAACVPGAFGAWMLLLRELGTLELADVCKYAIGYAEEGYPVV